MRFLPILYISLFLTILAGCKLSDPPNLDPDTRYRVVATTAMVADIVRNVAGERATIKGLIGEGVDPHLYKPTRADVSALSSADVVFYSGLLLEGKMTDVLEKIAESKPVVPVTSSIDPATFIEASEFAGNYDPHLWMDAQSWSQAVESVVNTLSEFDPPNASVYRKNADLYQEKLASLDDYAQRTIATIPAESRVLVTAHDAFSYLGRSYDIEVLGIQGINTESEAGLDDLNRLVDTIVQKKIRAVFIETSVADKNIKALIEGASAQGFEVKIGGELFSDAMGQAGTYEGTYIGMIDHNVTTIVRALGGEAPEKGLNGELR